MSRWGSGYSYDDPCYCDTWDDFVYKCNNPGQTGEVYTYIALPTVDQQGNPIPPERRVMDLRSHDWYRSTTIIEQTNCYLWIEGNGWTILGLSIRDTTLFKINKASSGSTSSKNWKDNFVLRNLNIKNVYLQGTSCLFKTSANGARIREISGCKFSGVHDMSTLSDPYNNTSSTPAIVSNSGNSYAGYNVITACSFNFKFVGFIRIAIDRPESAPTNNNSNEFNNCLFNLEGKLPNRYDNPYSSNNHSKPLIIIGKFYFCKFTGKLVLDTTSTDAGPLYYPLFWCTDGTLNVIDFKVSYYPQNFYSYNGYLEFGSGGGSQCHVLFIDKPPDTPYGSTGGDVQLRLYNNSETFKIPSSRAQMTDETWLTNNGFVVGSAPTD